MATGAAVSLYWPPIKRLYDILIAERPGAPAADGAVLSKYKPCLEQGLLFFKGPNATSQAAVQGTGTLFPGGGPKIPIQEALRDPALRLSAVAVRALASC